MRLRRTAVVLACTAALTACGTSVPVAVLPTTASSSTTSAPGTTTAPSPTFTRPDVIPPIDSITATGDPGRILGDTAGSYPGRLEVTGTDPRTIHRQVRAGMLTEFKRILDGAGMHFTRSQVCGTGNARCVGAR